MEVFLNIVSVFLPAVFVQNAVLERALGANVLLYASRRREHLVGFFAVILYITAVSSPFAWLYDTFFGSWELYGAVMPLLYIVTVGVLYLLTLVFIWRFIPKLFRSLKGYVHLAVFNCAVIGALFLCTQQGSDILTYLFYGIGTGIGFLFAAYLLYIASERLNSPLVPAAFRGYPIMIVYVGILSLALYAFTGYSTSAV